ncbi:alpha-N-acetylglucosaminidase [Catenulispora sp. EB89]|uniref:alpha-N-acetylglucosaminidase n=1 Tax=Catenulispora sp. EB89 TaxID=3156257 RepID=UPI00351936AD
MVGRRQVMGYGIAAGALAAVGIGEAVGSRSVAHGTRPDTGAVDGSLTHVAGDAPVQAFDTAPARGVLERLLPAGLAGQIELHAVSPAAGAGSGGNTAKTANAASAADTADRYRIRASALSAALSGPAPEASAPTAVTIEGTTTSALLAGTAHYLKYIANVTISLPGDSLSQLAPLLPTPHGELSGTAAVAHRFALNDTENGYAGAYRTWPEWERTLDVLALHGFTEVLVAAGQDEVYRRVFTEFGYTPADIDAWIPAASHQPWWLLGNLQAVDAPEAPGVRQAGVAVIQRVVARLRELGMTPVLPGYLGQVPPGFAERDPGAGAPPRVLPQGIWDGYQRPDWLDPRDPHFARIAESFYRHQADLYGATTAYKMDLLHEGGSSAGVPMGDAAVAVMTALQTARPGATWVMLGWEGNPRRDVLDALRACGSAVCARGKVLIVDGCSDKYPAFDREDDWGGTAYAFGAITNFGGRSLLGANAATWTHRFAKALAAQGSALSGIAWMPEASGHDPAAFELFAELAWRPDAFDLTEWFGQYAGRRYGKVDAAATKAWQAFAQTAYSLPPGAYSQAQDSLFSAWPDLSAVSAAPGGPDLRYDAAAFEQAVLALLQADPSLRTVDAYRYDVIDFTRQALSNHARVLLPKIKAAYDDRDPAAWHTLTARWLKAMTLLDSLLATDKRFLLGTWLGAGGYEARSLITTWGDRGPAAQLRNYGARELSGLVADVYLPRWRKQFAALELMLTGADNGTEADTDTDTEAGAAKQKTEIDWFALDDAWARGAGAYPTGPSGDPFAVANTVASFLSPP